MHLVIVSPPRAGAHMLRSMLRAEPLVDDIGAFIFPDDGQVVDPPPTSRTGDVRAVYERELAARPGRLLLSHVKLMHGHFDAIRAAADTGGLFVMLTRCDRLAQACSLILAMQHGAFIKPAPQGATIAPDPAHVRSLIDRIARIEETGRRYLEGLPFVDLAYEDLLPERVAASVLELTGMKLTVAEPTTRKSAPRLADFVTNLSEHF